MSDGAKKATIQLHDGCVIEVKLAVPGTVRMTFHGHRGKQAIEAPPGSEITRPALDARNADDREG